MSLLSLRKHNLQSETVKRLRHKVTSVSAEQFIEQAISYANGQQDNVIPFQQNETKAHVTRVSHNNEPETADTDNQLEEKVAKQPYRRATFTLSENCIDVLNLHAKQQHCAKSHLVRMLIRHFAQLPQHQQNALLAHQKDQK